LLNIQNTLTILNASTPPNTFFQTGAFIEKKFVGIELSGTEVPVPASFILFSSALGLMVVARKSA